MSRTKTECFFVTGTDTGVGKTSVATALLHLARNQGKKTAAVKPVAAGCEQTEHGLRNNDAVELLEQCSVPLQYEQLNPVALAPAIAPHIAAQQSGKRITVSRLAGFCRGVMMSGADFVLIEGAGGWRVPLNNVEQLSGLPKELNLPVILVVGMRLGCLNHAQLTVEAIRRDGLQLSAWVANQLEPDMPGYQENLSTLKQLLPAPCMGEIPYLPTPSMELVANYLNISKICQ